MKNKYQKPAIYLTPEHTEGIYLASGAAGAAGSVTATYMGVWDRWAGGGKGLVAVNWNNVAGNVALTLASTSISGNSVTVSFNPDGGSGFNLGLHVNHSGADINSLDMTGQSYTVS